MRVWKCICLYPSHAHFFHVKNCWSWKIKQSAFVFGHVNGYFWIGKFNLLSSFSSSSWVSVPAALLVPNSPCAFVSVLYMCVGARTWHVTLHYNDIHRPRYFILLLRRKCDNHLISIFTFDIQFSSLFPSHFTLRTSTTTDRSMHLMTLNGICDIEIQYLLFKCFYRSIRFRIPVCMCK